MAQENLTGVRVVRAFGREKYERDRFEKHNEFYTGLWVSLGRLMSFFWSSADVLSGIQIMLVVVFGVLFCLRGSMTSGEFIAFISYNGMLVWPVRQLGRMISEMSKAGVGIDRIGYIMDAEEEKDPEDALTPPMTGDICFDHVSFAYEGSREMLHDVTFTIPARASLPSCICWTGSIPCRRTAEGSPSAERTSRRSAWTTCAEISALCFRNHFSFPIFKTKEV